MWSKKELDILPDVKSKDQMNRERMPKDVVIPKLKKIKKSDKEYINSVISDINSKFNKNYGNTDNFVYPVTHKTAKSFLKDFIKINLKVLDHIKILLERVNHICSIQFYHLQ